MSTGLVNTPKLSGPPTAPESPKDLIYMPGFFVCIPLFRELQKSFFLVLGQPGRWAHHSLYQLEDLAL